MSLIEIKNLTTFGDENLTMEEENLEVPGVYKVFVYAINRNYIDVNDNEELNETNRASNIEESVLVEYERYHEQKSLLPKKSIELFDPRAVDLEVNFNEGDI